MAGVGGAGAAAATGENVAQHVASIAIKPILGYRELGHHKSWTAQIHSNDPCEDTICTTEIYGDPFVGVFDGHGGRGCADFCALKVASEFRRSYKRGGRGAVMSKLEALKAKMFESNKRGRDVVHLADAKHELEQSFTSCDRIWLDGVSKNPKMNKMGCCALACYCENGQAFIGNAGDCRAVLGRLHAGGQTGDEYRCVQITQDHTASNSVEQQLVARRSTDPVPFRASNRSVKSNGPQRVAGSLMVTRALGDAYLKDSELSDPPFKEHCPYITAQPETFVIDLTPEDKFIVLASDGIWDLLSNESVVKIVGKVMTATTRLENSAAGSLVASAPLDNDGINPAGAVVARAIQKICQDHGLSDKELCTVPAGSRRRQLHDDMTVIVLILSSDERDDHATKRPRTAVVGSSGTMPAAAAEGSAGM